MAAPAKDPKDVLDFKFRSMRRIKLEDGANEADGKEPTQKLAVSNDYGLLFAGGSNALHCFKVADLEKADDVDKETRKKDNANQGQVTALPSNPTHLGLNANQTILAVCVKSNGSPNIYLFDTRAFLGAPNDIKPFLQIPGITPPGVCIKELAWNPVVPEMLAVVFTNGSLAMYLVKADGSKFDTSTLPPGEGISCVSWSPKGKQLVCGKLNGDLTQYKPDLSQAKTMNAPSDGQKYQVISVLWISTYQFLTAYKNLSDADSRPGLYLVQGAKAGPTTFINYDDICYSTGEAKDAYFNMIPIPEWNVIFAASYNAMEIGVFGSEDAGQNWLQWLLPDSGRAELPLKANNDERYPVGLALATCTSRKLPLEENNFMNFSMPILFALSQDGLLSCFYAVNQVPGAPQVTKINGQPSMENIRKGTIPLPTVQATPKSTGFGTAKAPLLPKPAENPINFGQSFIASTPIKVPEPVKMPEVAKSKPAVIKPMPILPEEVKAPTIPSTTQVQKSESGEIRDSFEKAIKEEILAFEQELALLKKKSAGLKVDIGTTEEKTALKVDCQEMDKFCQELVTITSSQNQEIHELQSKMLEAFEWAEEAKSRDVRNKDPRYQRLLKARALDPLSQRRLSNVQSKYLFLEQQIDEANMKLDLEWEDHLEKCKKGGSGSNRLHRLETASKDTLYRVLVNHTNIIESQKSILDGIEQQVKELKMRNVLTSRSEVEEDDKLEKLSASLLQKTRLKAASPPSKSSPKLSDSALASPTAGGFSPEKSTALRSFLQRKGTQKVKPDPELSKSRSESVKKVAATKSKQLVEALKIPESKAKQTLSFKSENAPEAPKSTPIVAKVPEPSIPSKPALTSFNAVPPSKPTGFGDLANPIAAKPSVFADFGKSMTAPNVTVTSASTKSAFGSMAMTSTPSFMGLKITTAASTPPVASIPKPVSTLATKSLSSGVSITPVISTPEPPKITAGTSKPSAFSTSGSGFGFAGLAPVSAPSSTSAFGAVKPTFGTPTTTTAPLLPTPPPATTPAVPASVTIKPVVTSTTPAVSKPIVAPTTTSSPFATTPSATTSSIFGGSSVFGTSTTSTSVFGSPSTTTASSVAKTTTSSIFGSTGTASAATGKPLFGATTTSSSSIFGAAPANTTTSTTTSGSSIFGSTAKTTTTTASTTAAPTSSSVFGTATKTTAPTAPTTTTPSSSTSIFGGSKPAATPSVFGATPATGASSPPSIFGSSTSTAAPGATSTSSSIFGSASTKTTPATTSSSSIFGSTPTTGASSTSSIFGGGNAAVTAASSTSSVFGGSSVFSSPSTASAASAFGGFGATSSAPTSSSSVFGGTSSAFGTPATSAGSVGSAFGTPTPASSAPSAFGTTNTGSTSVFGGKPAFGATSTASSGGSVFGGGSTTTATTTSSGAFGTSSTTSATSSIFGGSSGGSGGGFFSGLGASPSTANANKNVFGGSFGGTPSTTSQSLFGGSGQQAAVPTTAQSTFGGFGSPAATSSGATFGSSTFGTTPNKPAQAAAGGFGSPPAFGGAPTFGGAPSFGSSPSSGFGAAPTFGSGATFGGGATFGSSATAPSSGGGNLFGAASNAPTFGSIASSGGGSTFGSVAQQGGSAFGSPNPPAPASGGFGSSPSSFGGGGSSFSSWR